MKKIGLIIAMECEKDSFIESLQHSIISISEELIHGKVFTKIRYLNFEIVMVLSGIGKVNAAIATTLLIEKFKPELIINSGIAGGFDRNLKTLDLLAATSIAYSDVVVCTDDSEKYGQIPSLPEEFPCSIKLLKNICGDTIKYGKILSGDQFAVDYQKEELLVNTYFKNQNVLAFDMESGAIAQVCYIMSVPLISLKSISDIIGETNLKDYYSFSIEASKKIANLVITILNELK